MTSANRPWSNCSAEYACHVAKDLDGRPRLLPRAEHRESLRRTPERLLRPVGDRREEMPDKRSVGGHLDREHTLTANCFTTEAQRALSQSRAVSLPLEFALLGTTARRRILLALCASVVNAVPSHREDARLSRGVSLAHAPVAGAFSPSEPYGTSTPSRVRARGRTMTCAHTEVHDALLRCRPRPLAPPHRAR